jgi:starch synthase
MKYGTVPVVRATGGLEDTIEEWRADEQTGTGFKFYGYHPGDLLWAIDRALWVYHNDKDGWKTLMLNGMAKDYSWVHPAKEYVEVYEEVQRRRG